MKATKLAAVLVLGVAAAAAQSSALAGPPDDREVYEMLKRSAAMRADGMVTKSEFVKLMEKRFDTADKNRKGVLTPQEIAKILDPNVANP